MTVDDINQFFSFLYRGWLGTVVFWLRLIAGVVSAALFAGIIVIAVHFRKLLTGGAKTPTPAVPAESAIPAAWQDIIAKIESNNPADWNLAVIRADALFDSILQEAGVLGETMGDRLKQLDAAKLESLNDVWEAHKMRNRIAHGTDQTLTQGEADRAVKLFAKGLRELGYLP